MHCSKFRLRRTSFLFLKCHEAITVSAISTKYTHTLKSMSNGREWVCMESFAKKLNFLYSCLSDWCVTASYWLHFTWSKTAILCIKLLLFSCPNTRHVEEKTFPWSYSFNTWDQIWEISFASCILCSHLSLWYSMWETLAKVLLLISYSPNRTGAYLVMKTEKQCYFQNTRQIYKCQWSSLSPVA